MLFDEDDLLALRDFAYALSHDWTTKAVKDNVMVVFDVARKDDGFVARMQLRDEEGMRPTVIQEFWNPNPTWVMGWMIKWLVIMGRR